MQFHNLFIKMTGDICVIMEVPGQPMSIGVYWGKGGQITKLQIEDLYLNNTFIWTTRWACWSCVPKFP